MKYIKLGDICNIKSSKRIYQSEYCEKGVPFYRGKEISQLQRKEDLEVELFISRERYEEIKEKFGVVNEGDLLITSVGTIGNTWVSDGREFYYKDGNITQIEKNKNINTKFLSYLFKSDIIKKQYLKGTSGTAQVALTIEKLNKLEIPDISLNNQNKIVDILDSAQKIIDNKKEQIELLDKLVKSRFIELFGSPFIDEKNFGMGKLGDVTLVNPKKAEVKELDDELDVSFVPMDRVGEKGEFKPEVSKPIKEVYSGFTYFKDNDVLFAKITPCMENGKGAVARDLTNGIGFGSTEFHVMRPIAERSNPYWIYHLSTLIEFRRLAERKMTGSAGQKRVSTDFINSVEVVIPPIELQNQFSDFVKQVDKLKFEMEKSLKELEDNFNSLMQKAFKGELFN